MNVNARLDDCISRAHYPSCSGAFCTIHECIDRRNNECLSVKIVKLPKMTATTGLEIEGRLLIILQLISILGIIHLKQRR